MVAKSGKGAKASGLSKRESVLEKRFAAPVVQP
jgi:hypothetical protein